MTPDEIRTIGKKWRDNNRSTDGSVQTAILVEIAAQLAELNQNVRAAVLGMGADPDAEEAP